MADMADMAAFVTTTNSQGFPTSFTYKAYLVGPFDIKVLCPNGDEYWFSQHQADPTLDAQLRSKLVESGIRCGDSFNEDDVVLT